MGEPDPRSDELRKARNYIRNGLTPYKTQILRLLDHLEHMDQGDLDRLHPLVDQLEAKEPAARGEVLKAMKAIHDEEQCRRDMEREGVTEPEPSAEKTSFRESLTSGWESLRQELWRHDR